MKSVCISRNQGQVQCVGNYAMTGKVFGKGHFARVEEATHRIIGKKVAIKIIDLTCIKEEYARRNLHREPRVMSRLRHPCIAALYETMMHGPRLYVVMEAARGGDLCAHVLGARGGGAAGARGLPEPRARALAAQLVSAVRHMHARGVVHRDLKMENIMLDSSKQFIKIVDFGLSNVWGGGGGGGAAVGLRTPCGSLEYAAPELFRDNQRYGPEVDLWSLGVIVFGMVTGGLPFTGGGEGSRSRPQLRAAIARGFCRKQRNALNSASIECKTFIQHLLEPNVELRMRIEEAARHRWLRRPGLVMKTNPMNDPDYKVNRDLFRQISEVSGKCPSDVAAQIKAEPFGPLAGIYNIKVHQQQLQSLPAADLLWAASTQENAHEITDTHSNTDQQSIKPSISEVSQSRLMQSLNEKPQIYCNITNGVRSIRPNSIPQNIQVTVNSSKTSFNKNGVVQKKTVTSNGLPKPYNNIIKTVIKSSDTTVERVSLINRPISSSSVHKQEIRTQEIGDCKRRLPSIQEHSTTKQNVAKSINTDLTTLGKINRNLARIPLFKKLEERAMHGLPKSSEGKRIEFYRKGGDGLPSWKASGSLPTTPARILLQNHAASTKRSSLGNIVSPHSSTNSHCKSDRTPIGWYASSLGKNAAHLQRYRKAAI